MERSAAPVLDVSAIRMRVSMVTAGVWLTFVICVAGFGYVALTWDRPGRQLLVILFALGVAGGVVVQLLPTERIVRSRWREPFFLAWSVVDLGLVAALVATDGGVKSPLALIFFVPVVFAAMSYPLPSVVAVGALTVAGYLGIAAAEGQIGSSYVFFLTVSLSCTAVMSAWQARNQDRQRCELTRVSRADPLTGCLNRRGLADRAAAELAHALREGAPFSLIVLDLDDFKRVNDTHGHTRGDELLCWVVEQLRQATRPTDAIGRLGGDEFAVLLPGTGAGETATVAARIRDALVPRASASVGAACFPLDGSDLDGLLREADARLYSSRNGRLHHATPRSERLSWATALAHAVDMRMAGQHEHSRSVAEYAEVIACELQWDDEQVGLLRLAAMLHDVGKVGVPDRVLRKAGPLTEEEFEEIKRHPVIGSDLVRRVDGLSPIVSWIRHSHEHFDGSGYPDGLEGEAIPLAARILLVADALDAMTSDRPYRTALSREHAVRELRENAGTQFDPLCVALLAQHVEGEAMAEQATI
jgi:diguanylate cyclase (GGDEF)-like protein